MENHIVERIAKALEPLIDKRPMIDAPAATVRQIQAASLARAAVSAMMGLWEPIETAPKDRTDLLLWDGCSLHVGYHGWEELGKPVWFTGDHSIEPLYWMHLPVPPPEVDEEQETQREGLRRMVALDE